MAKTWNLGEIKRKEIPIIEGTIFDIFGGLPQAFIGIEGEAGAGKSQVLMRLIADLSLKEKILVILTEQAIDRWYALFYKYVENDMANPKNINIKFSYFIDENLINELKNVEERVIIFDSISGGLTEQNARNIVKKLRNNLSEYGKKWIIGSFQVRGDNVAGGMGVLHNVEVLFSIINFTLKPQNRWLYKQLMEYGYEYGDTIRLIKNEFNKILGVKNKNIITIHFNDNGIVELIDIGKKDYSNITSTTNSNDNNNDE